jgi:predicted aspartyl protease
MPKPQHFAFRQEYPALSLRLITEVEVFDTSSEHPDNGIKVRALWDTGATGSAITPEVAKKLNLVPINRTRVSGVNSVSMVDVVEVSIGLPNKVMVENVNVMVCNLNQKIDILIGMDIILTGDFSISNGEGKTLFSFAIPPFKNKTDHYEKAFSINRRNK